MENEPESGFRMSVIEVDNGEKKESSFMSPNNEVNLHISTEKQPEIVLGDSKRYNKSIMEIEKNEEEPHIVQRLSSAELESVIFIFVDSKTCHEKDLLNIGVKKIEFKEKPNCTVYLFDKDDSQSGGGVETLKSELNRGNIL